MKLRATTYSSDPKKIDDTFGQFPRVEGVTTWIPHLEAKRFLVA
jgi:hypothetical protein